MHRFFVILILFLFASAQTEITVYVNSGNNKFNRFEKAVVEKLVEIHNKRSKTNYVVKQKPYDEFKLLFDVLAKAPKDELVFGMNSISITKERSANYSFSHPYLSTIPVVLSKTQTELKNIKNATIGYTQNSIQLSMINELKKTYSFKEVAYSNFNDKYDAVFSGKDTYAMGDYIDHWIYDLNIVHEIDSYGKDNFGVIFAKNSKIYAELKSTMKYYFSSPSYFELVKEYLGSDAVNFIRKNISSK